MKFDITAITNALAPYKNQLEQLYLWNADISGLVDFGLISKDELSDLLQQSIYNREVKVKNIVHHALHNYYISDRTKFEELSMWIIVKWGGIRAASKKETILLINNFIEKGIQPFERIASYSKVASFMCPEECIIYDARVAYTLNWLILSRNAGTKFFPIPLGRNSKMKAFDMDVLIRLKHIDKYHIEDAFHIEQKYISNRDKQLYIPKNEAYCCMNTLIKAVHQKLWNDERKELYFTEMLLFSIADNFITKEITESIRIQL
ncbi:hypothetical protein [Flammeovirga agarivorans]|uniref:Uncharacterized protein n=1 Tax=Flammeovirga agarivorans TaxID=2726742 RepID=A0A7X8SP10_9BACT|nr:hypothetical protein [Flammeovirga agarivorans]NLR93746.1 hypothetical protein [Flammeovirga agarivorans]